MNEYPGTLFSERLHIKILQKQLCEANEEYKESPLSIDSLITTLQGFLFRDQMKLGYGPCYMRTPLTDRLQQLSGIKVNTQIITPTKMKAAYRMVNKR